MRRLRQCAVWAVLTLVTRAASAGVELLRADRWGLMRPGEADATLAITY